MKLSEPQKRHLKGLAHHLKPVVIIGQAGVTEGVLGEIGVALDFHELIKVKVNAGEREERDAMIEAITTATGAVFINRIGHVAIFFRRNSRKPKVVLPA
ncbi:MAG: RNA-binding protein [Gammaproteobacteria bacterium RIFOXYA12_FULL_61_12]|nr:MAG: RNA-binding protein [Gammaproteobacteria bacterium RIFOXYD12_FULL_61_37]OGT93540.1 MAG: RNA-binding protein [Gammaproteobacteria bacterium RIFOXYA12_FULL_61_12]